MANWNVNQIYEFVKFLLRKNQAGSVSTSNFFYAWNSEANTMFQDWLGRWQNRNNGKTGNNTGLIENETLMTKLSPFINPVSIALTSGGKGEKPDDFAYELGLRINGYEVEQINHGQIFSVNNSVIDPPSIIDNKYYAVQYLGYYQFFPTTLPTLTITTVELDYIKTPTDIVWGYTFDSKNRQVYNSGTSVQPEFLQQDIIEITKRTLNVFGVSYHDKEFENFGKSVELTGE